MIKRRGFLSAMVVLTTSLFLHPSVVVAESSIKKSGMKNVVELFTSQGCSSCPPADALLEAYTKRDDVIALSYSVDYWDYLGWKDTYGSPENSRRQRNYARTRGDRSVYTPQVVVNGLSHMNGARKSVIERELKSTTQYLKGKRCELVAEIGNRQIKVSLNADEYDLDGTPVLWMVRVKKSAVVNIRRGENGGRKIRYHNVVLASDKVAAFKNLKQVVIVKKPAKPLGPDEHFVLLLQNGETGPILGALEL